MALLAAPLDDPEKLNTAVSDLLFECSKGNASLLPRAVVDKLLLVTEDDGVNLSLKISAYEILWCVSDGDSSASERTRDRAFADLKATGAPVVTIAALSTLQKQELSVIIPFLSASDTEKTLCGLLTGEAPAAVRAKACAVLAPVMMDVWIATDTFSASNTPPDSYPDLLHRRQDVQDKVVELMKAIITNCEDPNDGVAASAQQALLGIYTRYESSSGASSLPPPPLPSSSSPLPFLSQLTRRLSPRLMFLGERGAHMASSLSRSLSLRLITAILSFLLHQGGGSGSAAGDGPALHLDNLPSGGPEVTVSAFISRAISVWFLPALSDPSPPLRLVALECLCHLLLPPSPAAPQVPLPSPLSAYLYDDGRVHLPASLSPAQTLALSACVRESLSIVEVYEQAEGVAPIARALNTALLKWSDSTTLDPSRPTMTIEASGNGSVIPSPGDAFNSTSGLVAVTPAATPQRTQSSASLGSVSAVSVAGTPAQRTPAPSAWPSAAGRKLGRGRLAPPRGKIPAPQERSSSRPAASRISRAARKAVVAAGRRDGGVSWVPSPSSPSLFSLSLGEPVPVALTGGSDPILAEMFHGVDSTTHTLFVGVRATNGTRAHLPPMTLTLSLSGPVSLPSPGVCGVRVCERAFPSGIPPGATVVWTEGLPVTGLGVCAISLSARFPAPLPTQAGEEDDVVEEWGADGGPITSPDPPMPLTLPLGGEYCVPLSSFLLPYPLPPRAAGCREFCLLWARLDHSRLVDAVSASFPSGDGSLSTPSWLLSSIRPLGFSPVPWPSTPSLASAAFIASDWDGRIVCVTVCGEVCPVGEGREGGDMPPPPQTESPPAVVPNIFTLPRAGGRKGSDASLGAQTVVPPAAQNSGGDLLGLFDVFSPAEVAPARAPQLFPFASPVPRPSPARPLIKEQAWGRSEWRVRIEIRCDSLSSSLAFVGDVAHWMDEFTSGKLRVVRHFAKPPDSLPLVTEWAGLAVDGNPAGLFSQCGVGNLDAERRGKGAAGAGADEAFASPPRASSSAQPITPSLAQLFPGFALRTPP